MSFTTYVRILDTGNIPSLPLIDKFKEHKEIMQRIPDEILREVGYKEFLEKCFKFGDVAISEFRKFRDKYNETENVYE